MAALAAYELAATIDVARVYTYGQPRVGNAAWAAAFAALELDYARVVLYKDAVPHLPMDDMFWEGWTHAMPEVYYNATAPGAYRACDDAADARCSYGWNLVATLLPTRTASYLGMNRANPQEVADVVAATQSSPAASVVANSPGGSFADQPPSDAQELSGRK
ncbi:phospholipase [Aureococcus anophagefferens]|nr:phospholipase [Aureococcus anophagefferens]